MKKLTVIAFIIGVCLILSSSAISQSKIETISNNAFTFGYGGIYTDPFKKFNLNTPNNLTTIGYTSGCIYSGIDFGSPGGFLFGLHKYSSTFCELYRLDTINAACYCLSEAEYTGTLAGLVFNPVNWGRYVLTTGNPCKIYLFDSSSSSLLLASTLPSAAFISAISYNNAGSLYGIEEVNDNLVRINRDSGTISVVGPLGFNATGILGCDFDPFTGRMFIITPSAINPELKWIDTATGISTGAGYFLGSVKNLAIAGNIFTVPPVPFAPTPLYPIGTINTSEPLISWSGIPSAYIYILQVNEGINIIIMQTTAQPRYQVPSGILNSNTLYSWRVYAIGYSGMSPWSVVSSFICSPTGIIENISGIPKNNKLYDNYPNPFNPKTIIKFDIPQGVILSGAKNLVTLKVYDILGKEVSKLVNESLQPGSYEVNFDGSNLTSGVYFYKLTAGDFIETKKMILIK